MINIFLKTVILSLLFTFFFNLNVKADESDSETKVKEKEEKNLITNEFSVTYQNSFQILSNTKINAKGWQNNQLKASGQILYYPFMIKGAIIGNRSELKLENFSYNPVFSFDQFQGEGGLGYVWKKSGNEEIYAGLSYFYFDYKPDNKNPVTSTSIPYTNSYIDYENIRHAPGINAVYFRDLNKSLSLAIEGSLYPYIFSFVDQKNFDKNYMLFAKGDISLRYTIVGGFLVYIYYSNALFYGTDIFEDNNSFGVGLTLSPSNIKEE